MIFMSCGKIVCIGQNYRAHAKEMNLEEPREPVLFLKPPSSLIKNGEAILVPDVGRVDHEAELAIIIGRKARKVAAADAMHHISHVAVFNDVTARDIQTRARKIGLPWALSKGIDTFAPMSEAVPISKISDIHNLDIELKVNEQIKQKGNTSDMIFTPERLIEYISRYMTLESGDIIATGTPSGVGIIHPGDTVEITISEVGKLTNSVKAI